MRPPDYATPALVARAASGLKRAATPPTALLRAWEHVGATYAVCHDWTTYDAGVRLPGVTAALHLPLLDLGRLPLPTLVVFHPNPGRTGFIAAASDADLFRLAGTGICGKPIAFRTQWTVQRLRARPKVEPKSHILARFVT